MKHFMVMVMVALLMTAMLVVTMSPALAVVERFPKMGTPLPATVCESPLATSPSVGWRDGTCWVLHPAP